MNIFQMDEKFPRGSSQWRSTSSSFACIFQFNIYYWWRWCMVTHDDDNGTLLHNDLVLLVIEKLRDLFVCCVFQCFMFMLWIFLHVFNLFDVNYDVNGTCDDDVKIVMDPMRIVVLLYLFSFFFPMKRHMWLLASP
jgi:hypothetical protein